MLPREDRRVLVSLYGEAFRGRSPAYLPVDASRRLVDVVDGIEVAGTHDYLVANELDSVHMDDIRCLRSPVHVLGGNIDVIDCAPAPDHMTLSVELDDDAVQHGSRRRQAPRRQVEGSRLVLDAEILSSTQGLKVV